MSPLGNRNPTWIDWFCSQPGHEIFAPVDVEYIEDPFNLWGLRHQFAHFHRSISCIGGPEPSPDKRMTREALIEAMDLYGLIHARYILTHRGLQYMAKRYERGVFGLCPRVLCEGRKLLPVGLSPNLGEHRMRLYCSQCQEIYVPHGRKRELQRQRAAVAAGAAIGVSDDRSFPSDTEAAGNSSRHLRRRRRLARNGNGLEEISDDDDWDEDEDDGTSDSYDSMYTDSTDSEDDEDSISESSGLSDEDSGSDQNSSDEPNSSSLNAGEPSRRRRERVRGGRNSAICCRVDTAWPSLARIDGAYFGPSFPHVFLMMLPAQIPKTIPKCNEPKIFGFAVHDHVSLIQQKIDAREFGRTAYILAGSQNKPVYKPTKETEALFAQLDKQNSQKTAGRTRSRLKAAGGGGGSPPTTGARGGAGPNQQR